MKSLNKELQGIFRRTIPSATVQVRGVALNGTNLLEVDAGQGPIPVRAYWVGAGWPQDVRNALTALELGEQARWPNDLVLVGRDFSSGAIELLGTIGASWIDGFGRAWIVTPGMVISREGPPRPRARREFGWSPSAFDIAELLLARPWPGGFGTSEIANLSGWSAPQVSQVLQGFDENRWTVKHGPRRGRGGRRELVDPGGLLKAWSARAVEEDRETREASLPAEDLLRFLREEMSPALNEHVRWALSGWAAAHELAPFVTATPTLQIYVHEEDMQVPLSDAFKRVGLREVSEGGRIVFTAASPALLARSSTRGAISLASPPRAYADLLRLGSRGVEAAEHLKEEAIDPMHRRSSADGPSEEIVSWERNVKARLRERIDPDETEMLDDRYRFGTYSTCYILQGVSPVPDLPELRKLLQRAQGRETGWPVWWLAEGTPTRARPAEGGIEAWFNDNVLKDSSHSDFWRVEPAGRLGLIRGYDEDGEDAQGVGVTPGTAIDITLPLWRVAPAVRHAGRLGGLLGASRAEFMMHWAGLEGRKLTNYAERRRLLAGEYECLQNTVVSSVEFVIDEVEERLPELVKALVAPLYKAFEFFEPPDELYGTEIDKMREKV